MAEFPYNNSFHETLSKYAGQMVTPNEVDSNSLLADFITRRIMQENAMTQMQKGYYLEPGTQVWVYNEKKPNEKRRRTIRTEGPSEIVSYENGLFRLKNDETLPRSMITPDHH